VGCGGNAWLLCSALSGKRYALIGRCARARRAGMVCWDGLDVRRGERFSRSSAAAAVVLS